MAYFKDNSAKEIKGFCKKWITQEFDKDADDFTDKLGKDLSRSLSTSQIRNVYGELKRIQMSEFSKEKPKFILLKSKIAYATARKSQLWPLKDVFNKAYNCVNTGDNIEGALHFNNFMLFFESIIAYHKAYDGK